MKFKVGDKVSYYTGDYKIGDYTVVSVGLHGTFPDLKIKTIYTISGDKGNPIEVFEDQIKLKVKGGGL